MTVPKFAIVGHPNKGKSSLVAALASDDGVPVAPESGTTTRAVVYPMRSGGRILYELIDTPGFQRARRALTWMRAQVGNADDRPAAVSRFVQAHGDDRTYKAEVELLRPVTAGAGIIYVVDGAVPYGPEYEAEMEILRWTGQPSLAVINPIGGRAHVAQWRDALSQFFRIVREIDVLSAPLEQRFDLLRAFGELDERWRPALQQAVAALEQERRANRERSAQIIAGLLAEALTARFSAELSAGADVDALRERLQQTYRQSLRDSEARARDRVQHIYQHRALARSDAELAVVSDDLFSEQTWELFGLSRTALAGVGATGGAAAGFGVDAALGGASLFLGSAIGALAGGAATWFASDQMATVATEQLPMGEQILRVKAGANKNLPFVLLGRARLHHALVAQRSHARREPLVVGRGDGHVLQLSALSGEQRAALARLFAHIADAHEVSSAQLRALADIINALLSGDSGA